MDHSFVRSFETQSVTYVVNCMEPAGAHQNCNHSVSGIQNHSRWVAACDTGGSMRSNVCKINDSCGTFTCAA
eukprot:COSAG02_NODE_5655_length_4148_cov_172.597184_4_plen_72_part_00